MEDVSLKAHILAPRIRSGETKSVDLVDQVLSTIDRRDGEVGAYLDVWDDQARDLAKIIDKRAEQGDSTLGPLAGIPIAIKDIICTDGKTTTCGSKILDNFVPPYDATVIERLKAADAIIVGKTNLDEFAMGSSTEHSAFKTTKNPHDLERVPGGSSGGSAAAVAAGEAVLALGTDTGGSIRQPASFCGVVGLKPTYGRVSRYGLVAFASSLDQIGPFAGAVKDAALMLGVIAGADKNDSTCADELVPNYSHGLDSGPKGLRVGVITECFGEGLDPEIETSVRRVIDRLSDDGAEIHKVSLPHLSHGIPTYYLIATSEASANLARYDGVKYGFRAENATELTDMYRKTRSEGFGAEVKRRILLGTYALSSGYYDAYYLKAQKVRTLICRDFDSAFESVDVVIGPTAPTPAFRIGEKADDPLAMYLEDIYTVTANLAGVPGISVPCGTTDDGLPIGVQIMGKRFDEPTVLKTARAVEMRIG
ncbi:MAG: Asp-tRNA(Asn)/Glu-tRNA(Gln) amidotransferase subunit GatA [Candidatus Latescibacteria bacterium]|nr:Asp-tRNA(Asn)/Glu-tRNA(Gln) amidotransferase subunit GatA [Candidatus Latescibacterota bacterium]